MKSLQITGLRGGDGLLDLVGKVYGVPVYQLLGGKKFPPWRIQT